VIDIRVVPDGGEPWDVKVTARDVLKWERLGGDRSISALDEDIKMRDMYELAHLASQRIGKFTGSLTAFEDSCDLSFEGVDEGDFIQPEASTDPASPSQSLPESPRRNGQKRASKP
jgi:hypothetical protein